MKSQLCVWTSTSAALELIPVILMPSVLMNQETLPVSAKQGTLEMEVIVKVSISSRFAGCLNTDITFPSNIFINITSSSYCTVIYDCLYDFLCILCSECVK